MRNSGKQLCYTAVLQPEDYGPVIRCLIIEAPEKEDAEWLKRYVFPGPVSARFLSDQEGKEDPNGRYYTVFPVSGPDIEWTMAYEYDPVRERNADREFSLPGLICTGRVCPAEEAFIRRKPYEKSGIRLEYRDYLPQSYRNRKGVRSTRKGTLPLIIWLHGLGEGGTDTSLPLLGNRVTALAEATVQCYFPDTGAAVLVPQCPTMWMDGDGQGNWDTDDPPKTGGASYYTDALCGLIRKYLQLHPEVDRHRIYIGGCSNGGYMTLQMILKMPGQFAAAFPVCPAYHDAWMTPMRIRKLSKVPMWITAAATDQTVPLRREDGSPAYADALYEKLTAIPESEREKVIYSRLPSVLGYSSTGMPYEYLGHWSWIPVLQDRVAREFDGEEIHLFEWLAEQKINTP